MKVFLSEKLHPQTASLVQTRCDSLNIQVHIGDLKTADFSNRDYAAVLVQYPNTDGTIEDYVDVVEKAHSHGVIIFKTFLFFNIFFKT